jgi:hypothetical protein
MTNVDLATSFEESHIVRHRSRAGMGYLVDRSSSTIRRSRGNYGGPPARIDRVAMGAGMPASWVVRSKARGTTIFIPHAAVPDPSGVFDYEFVQREFPGFELPHVCWSQLFVDRIYEGLVVRIDLPHDLRKKDGGTGERRELLSIDDDELTLVDTRFDPDGRLYAEFLSVGAFPELASPEPELCWLDSRRPESPTTFLLQTSEPATVRLLPLPVSLGAVIANAFEGELPHWYDERFRAWVRASRSEGRQPPFDADRRGRYERQRRIAALELQRALELDLALEPFLARAR